ncbi:hypothetical protein CYD26_00590 [Pseudomonas sp. FFUP_PS_473]|nr:hypothetical protein CYD26_00590 [Pseudomonas sp. FFUP_PS_473]
MQASRVSSGSKFQLRALHQISRWFDCIADLSQLQPFAKQIPSAQQSDPWFNQASISTKRTGSFCVDQLAQVRVINLKRVEFTNLWWARARVFARNELICLWSVPLALGLREIASLCQSIEVLTDSDSGHWNATGRCRMHHSFSSETSFQNSNATPDVFSDQMEIRALSLSIEPGIISTFVLYQRINTARFPIWRLNNFNDSRLNQCTEILVDFSGHLATASSDIIDRESRAEYTNGLPNALTRLLRARYDEMRFTTGH